MHWVFPVQCCLESVGQYCTRLLPVQCCPNSITKILNKTVSCTMLPRATWTMLHKVFFLYNVVPRVLRQHLTGLFPVQCCLERLGQHCLRFLPVQCCHKRIKATLKRIFTSVRGNITYGCCPNVVQCCTKSIKTTMNKSIFCAMLSGVSWTILHKIFSCVMLSQEY